MSWPEIYLLCFFVGALWSVATLLLGGFHLGHSPSAHLGGHGHFGHGHVGHVGHGQAGHVQSHTGPPKAGDAPSGESAVWGWLGAMANPSVVAVYLAWFGGVGYLLTKHSGLQFWANLLISMAFGFCGASVLAGFLRFLQSHEKPLEAIDYEMVGTLARVSCPIRPNGVGEIIYLRDGARKAIAARSDDGHQIGREEEVIVMRFEKGIAYVRTWEAITQPAALTSAPEALPKETTKYVE